MSIRALIVTAGFVLAGVVGAAAAAEQSDRLADWTFSNGREFPGATGELKWNEKEGHAKTGCVEVQFNFDGGGNYVAAMMKVPADDKNRRARFWLKKPGRNRITFRIQDSTGQAFQKFVDYHYPDWQQIEIDLFTWVHSWGGAKDGKVHWPIKQFGVIIENDGDAKRGSYFIDGIELLPPGAESSDGMRSDTYTAAEFTSDEKWRLRGDGAFDGKKLSYQLAKEGDSTSIVTDYSLLGHPMRMKVRVISDGSGHELFVTLGSHFQHFERSLGRLTEKGGQVFEVELNKLEGWRHFDGENDGIARLPLRLCGFRVARTNSLAAGQVKFVNVSVETAFTPEQAVVILPDVVVDNDTAKFDVILRNLSATPVIGLLTWEARSGQSVLKHEAYEVTVSGKAVREKVSFSCPMKDLNCVEGAFSFTSRQGVRTPEASITAVRVPQAAPSDVDVNPIGMGVYLYRCNGPSLEDSKKDLERLATMAELAGVKWTREEINWGRVEKKRGEYDWSFYDELVKTATRHGMHVYGLLCYWPHYPEASDFMYTEKGIEEYVKYVVQVVRRYKGVIKHWEIWNEPNIFFWSGPKELYPRTLKAAYDAIKKEDPEALVLGCSTAGIDFAFIKQCVEAKAPFDVLTVHPYRGTLHMPSLIDELKRASELCGGKSVWITEMGWPTSRVDGVSERTQAGLVARTYLSALASGVCGSVSWYNFRNDGDDPFYNESQFGVLREDLRPKAGYGALAAIGRLFAKQKLVGLVDVGEGVLAHRFSVDQEEILAVSSLEGERSVGLSISPAPRAVLDAMGQPLSGGQDGLLCLALLDGWPVYVCGPKGMKVERKPLSITLTAEPAFAQPGMSVQMAANLPADAKLKLWHMPLGWPAPKPGESGKWTIEIPKSQPAGTIRVLGEFDLKGQIVCIPLMIPVRPAVLRVP